MTGRGRACGPRCRPYAPFVDESARGGLTICVAVVAPDDAAPVRSALRQLLAPGQQRLHMTKESAPRRRLILARLCEQPLQAIVYESAYRVHREGRAEIMHRTVANRAIDRLTIESAGVSPVGAAPR